jgi:hypothetical protein
MRLTTILMLIALSAGCDDGGGGGDGSGGSGSGGGGGGGGGAVGDDPCALLDADAIATFTGGTPSVGFSDDDECRYTVDSAAVIDPAVSINLYPSTTRSTYDNVRGTRPAPEDLDGIGDAAYYEPSLQVVQFLHGDLMVGVQLVGGDFEDAAVRDFVIDLARTADAAL